MNKKFMSIAMASVLAVSMTSISAFAADGDVTEGNNAFTSKASMMEAKINANIPTDLETYINPYGAAVTASASTAVEAAVKYSDGVISPTYKITNNDTSAGLKVTATTLITGSSTVTIATKPLGDKADKDGAEKTVFAFLNTTQDSATNKPVFASTTYDGNSHQVAFTEEETKTAGIMTLGKTTNDKTGWFYIGGECTTSPAEAWDSKDTISVSLVLDLSPSMGAAPDLTLASLTLDSTATTPVDIEKEFDGTKKVYEVAAKGSGVKCKSIKVTANWIGKTGDTASNIYVKYNGTFLTTSTQSKTAIGVTATAGTVGTSAANVVVTPKKDSAELDYAVGDVLEFIVVDGATNESTTYTINFI